MRERAEAARLIALVPDAFLDLLVTLAARSRTRPSPARRSDRPATIARDELVEPLIAALGRAELVDDAARALARYGNQHHPRDRSAACSDEHTAQDIRHELPAVLVRIGTARGGAGAHRQPAAGRRHASPPRHRLAQQAAHCFIPRCRLDPSTINLLLAAEIAGHYRSYQVLGPLKERLKDDDPVLQAMQHAMDQELDRIFRLMGLLLPHVGLHDAYVGLRSSDELVRANSLELLDNVLDPELRQLLVPLLDSQVSTDERIAIANRLVGAPLDTAEQAVETLLSSEDPWLRSSAIYAVGALAAARPRGRAEAVRQRRGSGAEAERARRRGAGCRGEAVTPQVQEPAPAAMGLGVGTGKRASTIDCGSGLASPKASAAVSACARSIG